MRRPVTASMKRKMRSRCWAAVVNTVVAPSSMLPVPRQMRWELMRVSSIMRTRMTWARSGISSVMPRSFSMPMQ